MESDGLEGEEKGFAGAPSASKGEEMDARNSRKLEREREGAENGGQDELQES